MKRKIIYVCLAILLALSQKVLAQGVGVGTTTPMAALEVSGHGKTGTFSYTDSAMGPAFTLAEYGAAPAGLRGEYHGTGANHGSGVLGAAMSTEAGYGTGVTGKGGYVGIMGLGMPGAYTAVYAAADSAELGLFVEGASRFKGDITATGKNVYNSENKTTLLAYTDSAIGDIVSVNYEMAPSGIRGDFRSTGDNDGAGVIGVATIPNTGYGIGVVGKGHWFGVCGIGMSGGIAGISARAADASYSIYAQGASYFNGDIYGTGTFSYTSDRKLKKNVQPITGALDIISKLRPSSYQFRVGEFGAMHLSEGKHYGVIAQELQQVLPELVNTQHYIPDNRKEKGFDYLSVNYNELIPILIKAVQEQQALNQALEKRIKVLEQKAN